MIYYNNYIIHIVEDKGAIGDLYNIEEVKVH